MTDVRILSILRSRFELAWQKYNRASQDFAEFLDDVPGHIPPPDGALRIKKAGAVVHQAHDHMMEALLALRAYENYGTVSLEVKKLAAGV